MATVMAGVAFAQQQATLLGTLSGHTDPVYAVAWSPDGKTIATAGFDNTVRLWEAATRKEIKSLEGHTKLVLAVAFSPDGRQLASGSLDNSAKIWDVPGGGPAKTLAGHVSAVAALAVKPNGNEAAVAAGRAVRIWDLTKIASIKELEGFAGEVASVAWRQDGAQIAAGDKAHTMRLWKGDFTPDGQIETPADGVTGLAYVPGKPLLVSAGSDGIARLWQLPVAQPRRIDAKSAVQVFAISHEGNRAATAGADKIVRVWTPMDGKLVKDINGNDQPVVAVALSGNGSQAAIALANKVVRICAVDDGKEIRRIGPLPATITALAFRNDSGQLAVGGDDKVIRVLVATGSTDKTVRVFDLNNGNLIRSLAGHSDAVRAVVVSGDGTRVVTAGNDKTVRFWNAGAETLF